MRRVKEQRRVEEMEEGGVGRRTEESEEGGVGGRNGGGWEEWRR